VSVRGELDLATVPRFLDVMSSAGDEVLVVLDLRVLTFVDVYGVRAVLAAATQARAHGRRLIAIRAGGQVDRMFVLLRVADRLEIVDLEPGEPPAQALLQLARIKP
jgi:anti-anti-sigma factor